VSRDYSWYKAKLDRALGKLSLCQDDVASCLEKGVTLSSRQEALEKAQIFLQGVAKETQEKIRFRLEDIVNLALVSVFGPKYKFEIRFEIKRGQTEASLLLTDVDGNEMDALESNGGGLADCLSFALRIALLIISKNRRVLILDEPMKFVSADLRAACYAIMQKLSKELDIQIIAVTHEEEFIDIADKVYRIQQRNGVSWAQSL
jgi:DNA repair exonuclease SbcCD ATPase subunit